MSAGQSSDRDRVRDASDIVRVVGELIALRPKGREYVGLCPFHDDHNPSMAVVPEKQIFYCFVCGAGGDVFSFVQKFHAMEFREALEHLANRAGVHLERAPGREAGPSGGSSRRTILDANQRAAGFFQGVLRHAQQGRAARELIERRGINSEVAEAFALGAAPDAWSALSERIERKGLDAEAFARAGLVRTSERSGRRYDAMRNRLVFPIRDQIGRVVAFGGRRINDEDEPKYLNSPEHAAFSKSSTLYGLHEASRAIQRERRVVVTEGYTDVIACHQAGFANTVATLGTALTGDHARLLRRLCETVILLFDSDEAGGRAADRAAEVFFAQPIDVRVATMDGADGPKDPDELLKREGGPEAFQRVLDGSVDLLEYRYRRLRERVRDQGPAALQRALEEELESLSRLGLANAPPLRRQFVIGRLSQITGLNPDAITRAMPSARSRAGGRGEAGSGSSAGAGGGPGALSIEEAMVGCVLCEPALCHALSRDEWEDVAGRAYRHPLLTEIVRVVIELVDQGAECTLGRVLSGVADADAEALVVSLQRRIETETDERSERVHALWRDCVACRSRRREIERAGPDADVIGRLEARRRAHRVAGSPEGTDGTTG